MCEAAELTLWNCYGPTESTFGLSILPVNHVVIHDEHGEEVVPIGPQEGEGVHYHIIEGKLYIQIQV